MSEETQAAGSASFVSSLWTMLRGSRQGMKDAFICTIPQIVGTVTGLIGSVLIARGLGPYGLGQLALVTSLVTVTGSLSDLGLGSTTIWYTGRAVALGDVEGQFSVLRWALRLKLSMVLCVTLCFAAAAPVVTGYVWHDKALTGLVQLGLVGAVFTVVASIPSIYFQSVRRFGMNAMVYSAQRVVVLGGILVLAYLQRWSVMLVIVTSLVATGFSAVTFLWIVPKQSLWRRGEIRWGSLRKALRSPELKRPEAGVDDTPNTFAKFLLLGTLIWIVTMQAPIWLMGFFLEKSRIGIYDAASRFTIPLVVVVGALNTALWPRVSAVTSAEQAKVMLKRILKLSVLVAGISVFYSIAAPLLAPVVFGPAYAASVRTAQVLCIGYSIAILGAPVGVIGYSLGLVRFYWIVNLVQMVLVVCMVGFLMPQFKGSGELVAAGAFVLSAIVWAVGTSLLVRWRMGKG